MYHFSQKKLHKFDRKTDFHQISFRGVSLNGKISLNFRMKFCVSLSIKHIAPLKYNIISKKKSKYYCPKWEKKKKHKDFLKIKI